jgi:hypothetical protein
MCQKITNNNQTKPYLRALNSDLKDLVYLEAGSEAESVKSAADAAIAAFLDKYKLEKAFTRYFVETWCERWPKGAHSPLCGSVLPVIREFRTAGRGKVIPMLYLHSEFSSPLAWFPSAALVCMAVLCRGVDAMLPQADEFKRAQHYGSSSSPPLADETSTRAVLNVQVASRQALPRARKLNSARDQNQYH